MNSGIFAIFLLCSAVSVFHRGPCNGHGGTPQYYAWYEIYPGASVTFTNRVSPGDQFSGSVTYASGMFTLVLNDVTRGSPSRSASDPAASNLAVAAGTNVKPMNVAF